MSAYQNDQFGQGRSDVRNGAKENQQQYDGDPVEAYQPYNKQSQAKADEKWRNEIDKAIEEFQIEMKPAEGESAAAQDEWELPDLAE